MMPTAWMLRPVGSASRTSRVITTRCVMLCVSTMGDSPVTVSVSSSVPTFRSTLIVGGEVRRQLDALAHDGLETGKREGHRVGAGPEREDRVLTVAARCGRADLFDQRRTGGFDGDAGHHGAGVVFDGAADGAGLRRCKCRRKDNTSEHENSKRERTHHYPPLSSCIP